MGAMDGRHRRDVPRDVIEGFHFAGTPIGFEPLVGGHIHGNFLVTCTAGRYVLQRLNDRVFPDLDVVLGNVERILAHLAARGRMTSALVESDDDGLSYRAADGSVWRAFTYLEGTEARLTLSRPDDAFETGRAFGDYLVALSDLPAPPLTDTIPRFHDLPRRLAQLDAVAASDPVGRRAGVGAELDTAGRLGRQVVDASSATTVLPVRTVHNDAKLSNVRFASDTGLALGVVDFDTTMPGHVSYDVGELVRTTTTHVPEDAGADATVDFDLECLHALAAGYFATRPGLISSEVDALALAGPQMALENAVRFLADHLDGDRYFAVDRPDQNLDRCRTQLRLTELMLASHAEAHTCFVRAAHGLP
jgi:N-acetylhexosamine 1-kinase